jgi:hypothetical protein
VIADRRRAGWAAAVGLTAVAIVVLATLTAAISPPEPTPAAVEHAAPKRPSLHAAPAGDAAALNAAVARRVPDTLAAALLPDAARPGVVFFLKADCQCSRGFAGWASALAAHAGAVAVCTAVIEGSDADVAAFAAATRLSLPCIADPGSELARAWGVRKAGAFALVEPDGGVAAVWPGISRQGFRDIADRLGVASPLPDDLLAALPGAATAGCGLHSTE